MRAHDGATRGSRQAAKLPMATDIMRGEFA